MATYSKETALYDTGAIASDITEAGTKATNYLAADSSGIMVYDGSNGAQTPSNPSSNTNNVFIDNNSLDIRKGKTALATFGADGAVIGQTNNVRVEIDEDSFIMIDGSGTEFAHIGSPKDVQLTDTFVYSSSATFTLSNTPSNTVVVKVNGTATTNFTQSGKTITVSDTLVEGDEVTITYTTAAEIKYYSLGVRNGDAGEFSVAEGSGTTASGTYSHAEGSYTYAKGYASHAEGEGTSAKGHYSHAEGYGSIASGTYSHAEGSTIVDPDLGGAINTKASGNFSHAEGGGTVASARYAHSEGVATRAIGQASHAEGRYTTARGEGSHAEGHLSGAIGAYSHAQNLHTVAGTAYQTAIGKFNENTSSNAFEIGNGASSSSRQNALTVTWDGNMKLDLAGYQTANNVDKAIYDALVALGWEGEVTA